MTTDNNNNPPPLLFGGINIAGFEFQLKSSATMPTLLVSLDDMGTPAMYLTVDTSPLLLPAAPGTAGKNILCYPMRFVIRSIEYKSEFLEEPKNAAVYVANVITELGMLTQQTKNSFEVLMMEHEDGEYHKVAPDQSYYIDMQCRVECSRETMMTFIEMANLSVQAALGTDGQHASLLASAAIGKAKGMH